MDRDPFWLQEKGARSIAVDLSQTEVIRHEILYEDEMTRLADRRMFVGRGFSARRVAFAFAIPIFFLACLAGRAGWMQVVQGASYRARADENRYRVEVLPARRGIIRDRNGVILAENVPSFDVRMRWSDLPLELDQVSREYECKDACEETIAAVGRTIGATSEEITSIVNATGTDPDEWIDVARDVPYDRALALEIKLPELSGVSLVTDAKRTYPRSATTTSLSLVLGYVGSISPTEYESKKDQGYRRTDDVGKTGVEKSHESEIRGDPGIRRTEVDAFGRPKAMVEETPPKDGESLTLAIDANLQAAAEAALERGMVRAKATRGSAIAMDPRDGSILAIVSLPSYDDNAFAGTVSSTAYQTLIENPDRPLFARAVSGQFPSGSTIKPLIAAAALAEGTVTARTTVSSVGGISVGPWFFPDWKAGGHGMTDVRKALAWSVNTFFYMVGGGHDAFKGMGIAKLTEWMRKFGLAVKTGVDLPSEAEGFVPSEEWKKETKGEPWYIGDTYNLSIGQGDLLVTPLQMARVTAAVANGGTLVTPHVVASASAPSTKVDASPDVWKTVQLGMRDCVTLGSCRALASLPVPMAGKTGTAQWSSDKPYHAWFTGYAPFDRPEIVVTVLIEEGGEGSSFAVPVAGDIIRSWASSSRSTSTPATR
jgi:penicillin-binding protein 2